MSGRVTYNPATGRCQWSQYSASPGRVLYKGTTDIIVHALNVRVFAHNYMWPYRVWTTIPELQAVWYPPRYRIPTSYYDTCVGWSDHNPIGDRWSFASVRYNVFRDQKDGIDGWMLRIYINAGGVPDWPTVLDLWRAGSQQAGAYEFSAFTSSQGEVSYAGPYTVTYARSV